MKHVHTYENFLNEGDMTNYYDGFIVLDSKTGKQYKFKYVKGTSNVKVEDAAIAKMMSATKEPRGNFGVRGFIKKGEWDKSDVEVFESATNEAKITLSNDTTYGRNQSKLETLFFGVLIFETNVSATTGSHHEPIVGSVTVSVNVGSAGSVTNEIKSYEIKDAQAKEISAKMKERYDTNNYKEEIPGLSELKEKIHKKEIDAFLKGLEAFERSYSK